MKNLLVSALVAVGIIMTAQSARAGDMPSIAVADLTYEKSISSHFDMIEAHHFASGSTSHRSANGTVQSDMRAASGDITTITRGELHQFTGDVKGALIKSGQYRVVQPQNWDRQDTTTIISGCVPPKCDGSPTQFSEEVTLFDIKKRIEKGFYKGADYVLFGVVTTIDGNQDDVAIQGSNAINHMMTLNMVVDFSLVSTKTLEVVAGFSALGEGSDSKLSNNPATIIHPNRARALRSLSQSLGDDVVRQVGEQFTAQANSAAQPASPDAKPKVMEYR